jgi:UDP-N-acetylglucosamine 2-epimerase (non-hydrolysing)
MEEGTLVMSGLATERVLQAVALVRSDRQVRPERRPERVFRVVADYEARNVSLKVVRIIASYVDTARSRMLPPG